jgi:hypothetical protein
MALAVLEKKIFKDLASFHGFSLPVWKIFGISEPFELILMRPTQGTYVPKISFLGIMVYEKIFKELLTHACTSTSCNDIRWEWNFVLTSKLVAWPGGQYCSSE